MRLCAECRESVRYCTREQTHTARAHTHSMHLSTCKTHSQHGAICHLVQQRPARGGQAPANGWPLAFPAPDPLSDRAPRPLQCVMLRIFIVSRSERSSSVTAAGPWAWDAQGRERVGDRTAGRVREWLPTQLSTRKSPRSHTWMANHLHSARRGRATSSARTPVATASLQRRMTRCDLRNHRVRTTCEAGRADRISWTLHARALTVQPPAP